MSVRMSKMGSVERLCIHHSAGSAGSVQVFRAEHKAKGWADIGYHAVIGNGRGIRDGQVDEGRGEEFQGSGVFGNNRGCLHVCLVGNFDLTEPTVEQLKSLGHWLVNRCRRYGPDDKHGSHGILPVFGHTELTVAGHRTACPGLYFTKRGHRRLGSLRTWLRERLADRTHAELDYWLQTEG